MIVILVAHKIFEYYMIYEINIVLITIVVVYTITLFYGQKEGFMDIDPHNNSGYIPYVPQDVLCMILDAAGVPLDRLGVMRDKCQGGKPPLKLDDSNTCRA